jgi:hypothetical protein
MTTTPNKKPTSEIHVLLCKYIQYIIDIEGTDYILDIDRRDISDVQFTDEEWAILTEAAKKSSARP